MGFLHGAAPVVVFAFWLGVAVITMTMLMLVVIVVMRNVMLRRERTHARAVAFWKPIVVAVPDGPAATVPRLNESDVSGFIQVWNEVHESLHGGTTQHLERIARDVNLEQHLLRFMQSHVFHDRIVAVIALGHVRTDASFARVAGYLENESPVMSLCAARSLMQIDPARAVAKFVPQIVQRNDWSEGTVATILRESTDASLTSELTEATLRASAEIAPRMIRLLARVDPQAAAPLIRAALRNSSDEHLVSTCLQVLSQPQDLDCVRPLLTHPRWHLRMQAAVTLGRLGFASDQQRLADMLSDRQWWVRYRAAQALMSMSSVTQEYIRWLQEVQTDKYARDIISHVLAERALGAAS